MAARKQSRKQAPARPVAKQRAKSQPPIGSHAGLVLRARWKWVLGAIVALHVVLALLVLQPAPHTGGDNAGYITLAKSLLERHKYLDLYDPTEPPHTQYPPVFPAILAIALTLGLKPWLHLKLLAIAFSATAVAFSYLWIRRHGRPELATGVALLLAVSPGVLSQSFWELSDVPFWAITMVAVWAWQRLPPTLRGRFIVAVLMTTLAYFTRSAGLPLLLAAGTWLVLRRRWRQLAVFAAVIVPLAFLWWWRARTQGGVDYVSQFWSLDPYNPALGKIAVADLFTRIADNGGNYLTRHLPILLFGREGLLPLSLLITALAFYGWLNRIRRPGIGELLLPLYLGLILVWPAVWSGERFLLPALPFLLFYAGDGLVRLTRMVSRSATRLVPAAAAAFAILIGIPATAQQVSIGTECTALYRAGDRYACLPQPWKDYFGIAELAPRLLPDGAAVLSRKARTFYVLGGVPGRQYPLSADPDTFFKEADAAHARYVVFDGLDALSVNYLAPVLTGRSDSFCILFGLGENRAVVFGITRGQTALATPTQPGSFAPCPDAYWRSTAVRDSLYQGLIQMP